MKKKLLCALMLLGCASDQVDSSISPSGSRGVTQAGAQDIAYFRNLVERGEVPEPDLLDQVGFFAEHALEQAPAECGEVVCAHPSLAVAPRFDEGTWTMGFVSLNSAIDPATRPRDPVHVILAVELSSATTALLGPRSAAMAALLSGLETTDRVSLVAFGASPSVIVSGVTPADALDRELPLPANGQLYQADLYAGIAAAADAAQALSDFEGATRIVLVTSGRTTTGITDPQRIEELATAIVREGTSFSVIGVGAGFQAELPLRIAGLGAGTYAYAEDGADLTNVLAQEGSLRMLPLATDVELRVVPSDGYTVGRVYGAARAVIEDGAAVLRMPALFLGARTGPNDVGMGRRGGGGGFFVELIGNAGQASAIGTNQSAFRLELSYVAADTGADVTLAEDVINALPPGQRPAEDWPSFSKPADGKAFMMLNMYLALRGMLDLYAGGDCASALGLSYMFEPSVVEWQRRFADPDIQADAELFYRLRASIDDRCRLAPVPPSNYEAGCFFI
jgi:Ca-activated chloride channel family protein